MNKTIVKRICNIVSTVFTALVVIFAIAVVAFTVFGEKDADGTTKIFNKQVRLVTTNSMAKCDQTDVKSFDIKSIPVNSVVFINLVPEDEKEAYEWYDSLEVGDVLTFKYVYSSQVVITHRLVKIEKFDNGSFKLYLEGDNKNTESNLLTQVIDTSTPETGNYVLGKVTGKSLIIGYLLTLLKNPKSLIFVIIMIIIIVVCINVIKKTLKQVDEEPKEKDVDKELEELKSKINRLLDEQSSNNK